MNLNYKSFGQGEPVIILHGLFGTLDNWQGIAKKLAENYTVYIIDQRNHGRSPHGEPFDYPTMSEDLRAFMESHWIFKSHIIGHSMGGKTAMRFALDHHDMTDKLVVVDVAPGAYPERHNQIFEALFALDLDNLNRRKEVEEVLKTCVPNERERQFLLKNLARKKEGGFRFKMNLPVIYKHYADILASIENPDPYEGETLFVRGGLSRYIEESHKPAIRTLFPNVSFRTIENAGHWVHADAPDAFLETVLDFLSR